jgi:hypothetical protein
VKTRAKKSKALRGEYHIRLEPRTTLKQTNREEEVCAVLSLVVRNVERLKLNRRELEVARDSKSIKIRTSVGGIHVVLANDLDPQEGLILLETHHQFLDIVSTRTAEDAQDNKLMLSQNSTYRKMIGLLMLPFVFVGMKSFKRFMKLDDEGQDDFFEDYFTFYSFEEWAAVELVDDFAAIDSFEFGDDMNPEDA